MTKTKDLQMSEGVETPDEAWAPESAPQAPVTPAEPERAPATAFEAPAAKPEPPLVLMLSPNMVQDTLNLLGQYPYTQVAGLVQEIHKQAFAQMQAREAVKAAT